MKTFYLFACLFLLFAVQICNPSFAIESESQREAIVSARNKRFYKSDRTRRYISFGGLYSSNYNSKRYDFTSRYLHQSHNFIHEINFDHEVKYADTGSRKNKKYHVKKRELYDFVFSSKARILGTKNYGVFYHRSIYDDLSKYYYDKKLC